MKNLKKLVLIINVVFFLGCSSTDDNDGSVKITVSGSIDTTALVSLTGNDATALVTLNDEPAATQTTEVTTGNEVSYEINTGSSTTEIVILNFFYTSGNREFWENNIEITIDSQSNPTVASLKVLGGAVGDEAKFGFTFALKTNGVTDLNTTYIVDPKIRVRS